MYVSYYFLDTDRWNVHFTEGKYHAPVAILLNGTSTDDTTGNKRTYVHEYNFFEYQPGSPSAYTNGWAFSFPTGVSCSDTFERPPSGVSPMTLVLVGFGGVLAAFLLVLAFRKPRGANGAYV